MKTVVLSVLMFSISILAYAEEKPLKVFILAGQSNMAGSGSDISALPEEFRKPQRNILFFDGNSWLPLEAGRTSAYEKNFGPEVSFGQAMSKELGEPIGIVKLAVPGTNLAVEWSPENEKSLYVKLFSTVKAAQKSRPIVISGMLWMQGERDSKFEDMSNAYQKNLVHLIEKARKDFEFAEMPFVCGRVNPKYPFAGQVRKAQESIDLPGYKMVNCDDLPKNSDNLHYSSKGQLELGRRFASAMLELIKIKTQK